MLRTFAHAAIVEMHPSDDLQAPGAAVTVALCGHWQHEPPCPLAPHTNHATRRGHDVHVRTIFAVAPELEGLVRRRIDAALAQGHTEDPDGRTVSWTLRRSGDSEISPDELEVARRLVDG